MPQAPPTYQELMAELYALQGGGPNDFFGDPYAASGGFPSPPMPNGKMPQYRTQGSGFVSDGTVRDYASMALADQDRFSTDAFIQADPELKPLIARAVAEAGNDPYAAYANFDDGSYREALINMAMQSSGIDALNKEQGQDGAFQAVRMGGVDADGNGKVDNGEAWTNDDAIAQIIANSGPDADSRRNLTSIGSGFIDPLSGREFLKQDTYANVLKSKLGGYEGALDNFFNNAAPSTERNLQDIEGVTSALGGMPFPSQGDGGTDYSQSGPGFGGGGAPAPNPNVSARGDWLRQYTLAMQEDARARNYKRPTGERYDGRRHGGGGSSRSQRRDMPARGGHESVRYVGGRPVRS